MARKRKRKVCKIVWRPDSMHRGIDALPEELVEAVVALLPRTAICRLRLVSRSISFKSSQGLFKTYFKNKTVAWTSPAQIEKFVRLTQPTLLGCLVQRLTVVGMATARSLDLVSKESLAQAFDNLRVNSRQGGLQSITLLIQGKTKHGKIVACQQIRDWKRIWETAARTFEITLLALVTSQLRIQQLVMFDRVYRCSMSCDRIAPVLDSIITYTSLNAIKSLTLSVSGSIGEEELFEQTERQHGAEAIREVDDALHGATTGQKHANEICRLLKLFPRLEGLELRWHKMATHRLTEAQREEQRFLTHVSQLNQLSQLRNCCLLGLETDEVTMLSFLKKAPQLQRLTLEEFNLESGSLAPLFNHLLSHMPHLEHLHFIDLSEDRNRVLFDQALNQGRTEYTLTMVREDFPLAIGYFQ